MRQRKTPQHQDAGQPSTPLQFPPVDVAGAAPDKVGQNGSTPASSGDYHFTEMGNADRLLDTYGVDFRWCPALGFCTWDGQLWLAGPEAEAQMREWAKQAVRDLYHEAAQITAEAAQCKTDDGRVALARRGEAMTAWALKSEQDTMVGHMLNLVRSAEQVVIKIERFDADPWRFHCANGTLDLRLEQATSDLWAAKLSPHRREDYLMHGSSIPYDPSAQAPIFERFLSEIMLGDQKLVAYLQRILGYSMTGIVLEHIWHLLVGIEGRNGKTTLMDIIRYVLGKYALAMQPESIMIGPPRSGSAPSPDVASLKGKRFVVISETEEGARLAPSRLKLWSGGDRLTARDLYKGLFEFDPTHHLFMHTNHKPVVRERTPGFWSRLRYIPFNRNLLDHPEDIDEKLPEKLRDEAPGILAWLVRGCLLWQRDGSQPPDKVLAATKTYRSEQNMLAIFLEACCVVDPKATVGAQELNAAYVHWHNQRGEQPEPYKEFLAAMDNRKFQQERKNSGVVWTGLRLVRR